MPTWPATLPNPAINSLTESPPNNNIRSQMDKGPDKVRRRTTANIRPLGFTLNLLPAQVSTLDTFYVTTTFSGSIAFDMTHPRTGAPISCMFQSPPQYNEREGVMYNATISLEILP